MSPKSRRPGAGNPKFLAAGIQYAKEKREFYQGLEHEMASRVLPGETYVRLWCQDCTECNCPPRGLHTGVPWLSIATGTTPEGVEYQRCLQCDTAWTAREYRWQPATVIRIARAA